MEHKVKKPKWKIPKIVSDSLQDKNGKWSIQRLAGMSGFYAAILYVFIPLFFDKFIPYEWAFWGLITFSASALGLTILDKKIDKDVDS